MGLVWSVVYSYYTVSIENAPDIQGPKTSFVTQRQILRNGGWVIFVEAFPALFLNHISIFTDNIKT